MSDPSVEAGTTEAGTTEAEEALVAVPAAPTIQVAPAAPVAADDGARPNRRKVREGLVVSNSMDKTAVVAVIERVRHPRYDRTVQRTKRLYVHVESNDVKVGDRVRVAETRPLSKLKHWRLLEVLERAK